MAKPRLAKTERGEAAPAPIEAEAPLPSEVEQPADEASHEPVTDDDELTDSTEYL